MENETNNDNNDNIMMHKDPIFWVNIFLSIATPIIAYYGLTPEELTTWASVFNLVVNALKNPYVVGMVAISLWNNYYHPKKKLKQQTKNKGDI